MNKRYYVLIYTALALISTQLSFLSAQEEGALSGLLYNFAQKFTKKIRDEDTISDKLGADFTQAVLTTLEQKYAAPAHVTQTIKATFDLPALKRALSDFMKSSAHQDYRVIKNILIDSLLTNKTFMTFLESSIKDKQNFEYTKLKRAQKHFRRHNRFALDYYATDDATQSEESSDEEYTDNTYRPVQPTGPASAPLSLVNLLEQTAQKALAQPSDQAKLLKLAQDFNKELLVVLKTYSTQNTQVNTVIELLDAAFDVEHFSKALGEFIEGKSSKAWQRVKNLILDYLCKDEAFKTFLDSYLVTINNVEYKKLKKAYEHYCWQMQLASTGKRKNSGLDLKNNESKAKKSRTVHESLAYAQSELSDSQTSLMQTDAPADADIAAPLSTAVIPEQGNATTPEPVKLIIQEEDESTKAKRAHVQDTIATLFIANTLRPFSGDVGNRTLKIAQLTPECRALLYQALKGDRQALDLANLAQFVTTILPTRTPLEQALLLRLVTGAKRETVVNGHMLDQASIIAYELAHKIYNLSQGSAVPLQSLNGAAWDSIAQAAQKHIRALDGLDPEHKILVTSYITEHLQSLTAVELRFLTATLFELDAQGQYGQKLFFDALSLGDSDQIAQAIEALDDYSTQSNS